MPTKDKIKEILNKKAFGTDGHTWYPMPKDNIEKLANQIFGLFKKEREAEYQRGFEDGSHETALQSKEIFDCKLKEIYKKIDGIIWEWEQGRTIREKEIIIGIREDIKQLLK